jgi:ATP-dependent exoDNAse (exonuclease V) alpha subunit
MNFQLRVEFAKSIKKSQGHTVSTFEICVPEPVFSRDQLYVALWKGEVVQKPENPSGSK